MPQHVIIDGNNLLYAMHAHAPVPSVGRETLVRVVERWARRSDDDVTLVFDGPRPRGGLAKQMASSRLTIRFSAPVTADDIIVALVAEAQNPANIRVVTGDKAILHAVGYRRSARTESVAFVAELFQGESPGASRPPGASSRPRAADAPGEANGLGNTASPHAPHSTPSEKPPTPKADEVDQWLTEFGYDDGKDEPFDGAGAMGS